MRLNKFIIFSSLQNNPNPTLKVTLRRYRGSRTLALR